MKRGLRKPVAICAMLKPTGNATACPDGEPSGRLSGVGERGAALAATLAVVALSATSCKPFTSVDCAAAPVVVTSSDNTATAVSRRHTAVRITLRGGDPDDAVATR